MSKKTLKAASGHLIAAEVFLRTVAESLQAEGCAEIPEVAALVDEAVAHGAGLERARQLLAADLAQIERWRGHGVCRFGPGGDYTRDWPCEDGGS